MLLYLQAECHLCCCVSKEMSPVLLYLQGNVARVAIEEKRHPKARKGHLCCCIRRKNSLVLRHLQGNVIKTMTSRHLRCFEMCTRDDMCKSVNVCSAPGQGPEISNCELLDNYSPWFCKQLGAAPDAKCFHAEKVR